MKYKDKIEETLRELEDMPFETLEGFLLDTKFQVDHANFGDKEQTLFLAGIEQGLEMALTFYEEFEK